MTSQNKLLLFFQTHSYNQCTAAILFSSHLMYKNKHHIEPYTPTPNVQTAGSLPGLGEN